MIATVQASEGDQTLSIEYGLQLFTENKSLSFSATAMSFGFQLTGMLVKCVCLESSAVCLKMCFPTGLATRSLISLHKDSVGVNFLCFIVYENGIHHTFQHMHNSKGNFSNCWGFGLVHPLYSQDSAGCDRALLPRWSNTSFVIYIYVNSPAKKITEHNESTKT